MKYVLGIFLPLYLLDQATKWLIVKTFAFQEERTVIPGFFDLVYWGNTGAAFSMLQGKSMFFILLATATLIAMAIFAWRGGLKDAWSRTAWSLLAAGIAGNL
ncbi:MAG TPA: signal peptidase II, partial [Chthoniobacterales bacterium]